MDYVAVVTEFLLPTLATLFIAALTPLAVWVGRKLAARLGIQMRAELEAHLGALVIQGIHFAEEKARQKLAQRGQRSSGAQKLRDALAYVQSRLDETGWVQLGAERLRDIIEAKLNYERPEMEALEMDGSSGGEPEPEAPRSPAGGGGTRAGATGVVLALLVAATLGVTTLGTAGCAPLSRAQADAVQTSASVGCDLVELWCDPDVIVSAPAKWCGLASGLCRAGVAGLTYVLPQFTERTLALSAAGGEPEDGEPEPPLLTPCTDWGYWCAHTDAPGAQLVCAPVERGCREGTAVTIAVEPASTGAAE